MAAINPDDCDWHVLIARVVRRLGLEEPIAKALAKAIVREIRRHHGGCRLYIPRSDRAALGAAVRRDFDGRNRDAICAHYGISRATFYRMLGEEEGAP